MNCDQIIVLILFIVLLIYLYKNQENLDNQSKTLKKGQLCQQELCSTLCVSGSGKRYPNTDLYVCD